MPQPLRRSPPSLPNHRRVRRKRRRRRRMPFHRLQMTSSKLRALAVSQHPQPLHLAPFLKAAHHLSAPLPATNFLALRLLRLMLNPLDLGLSVRTQTSLLLVALLQPQTVDPFLVVHWERVLLVVLEVSNLAHSASVLLASRLSPV